MTHAPDSGGCHVPDITGSIVPSPVDFTPLRWTKRDQEAFWGVFLALALFVGLGVAWIVWFFFA